MENVKFGMLLKQDKEGKETYQEEEIPRDTFLGIYKRFQ